MGTSLHIDPSIAAGSPDPAESARKIEAAVCKALQAPGMGVAVAASMGVSESTVSRLKNDHLGTFAGLLARLGLKVVPADRVCVDREMYRSMANIAAKALRDEQIAQRLIWDDGE